MAHDGEEKDHFEGVDQDKHTEEDIKSGQGQVGEGTEECVSQKRNPEHASGQEEAGFELPVLGMEKRNGKGQGHRTDDDEKKQDQGNLFAGMHFRDSD